MPTKFFNLPAEVLALATLARQGGYSRRAVLTAAIRAACLAPPPAPVAYPTLTIAVRAVQVPLSPDLHAALRIVEARCFYGRTAWLVFYALVHHPARVEGLLRLDAEALARQDAIAYKQNPEVNTCSIPLTTRSPKAPKASPPRG